MQEWIPSMPYLPPTIFGVILALGFLIGFWNGWKTALYFLVWNVIAFSISVVIYKYVHDEIIKNISNLTNNSKIKDFINSNIDEASIILGIVFSMIALIAINIIAFLIYWIVFPLRRILKRSIKKNKESGVSNSGTRVIGASIGVITALPIATFATISSTIVQEDTNKFSNTVAKIASGLSFGNYKNADEIIQHFKAYANLILDNGLQTTFENLFRGDFRNVNLTLDQKSKIEKALQGSGIYKMLEDKKLIDNIFATNGNGNIQTIDFTTPPSSQLTDDKKINISSSNFNKLVSSLKASPLNDPSKSVNEGQIKNYLLKFLKTS